MRRKRRTNLDLAMYDRGISQSRLAAEVGASQSAVSNWVRGARRVPADKVVQVAALLDLAIPAIENPFENELAGGRRERLERRFPNLKTEREGLTYGQ